MHTQQAQLEASHPSTAVTAAAAASTNNTGSSRSAGSRSHTLLAQPLQTDVSRQLSGLSARIRAAAVHSSQHGSRPGSVRRVTDAAA
jgi:hypothetical protein